MARRSSVVVPSSVTNPIRRLSNVSFVPPPRNMRRMSTQLYGVSPLQRSVTFKEPPTEMTPEAPYAMAGSPMARMASLVEGWQRKNNCTATLPPNMFAPQRHLQTDACSSDAQIKN